MSENIYKRIVSDMNGRTSKKVANNTYLQRRDEKSIALKYHATDVVVYHDDGRVVLNSGGWRTSTTKLRYNESYARLPIRIWANRGVWYVSLYNDHDNAVAFDDGLTLQLNGDGSYHVVESTVGEDPKKTQKLRKRVDGYAKGFIAALRAGKVEAPSAGDCMLCALRDVKTGIPWGESQKDHSHIESHIAERYYVPSLLVRACEVMPCSQVMKWTIGEVWKKEKSAEFGWLQEEKTFEEINGVNFDNDDYTWIQLTKMLKRYVLRQLGEVS